MIDDGKVAATLEELEETVQSTYPSVLEDAVAAFRKPSTADVRNSPLAKNSAAANGSFEQLVVARLDAIDRQLAVLLYKLS